MKKGIIDASTLLAFLHAESGSDIAATWMQDATMSAVNYAEVLQKLVDDEDEKKMLDGILSSFNVSIVDFDREQASHVASIFKAASKGISIADRACLSLGRKLALPVVTGDQAWASLDLGLEIVMFRSKPH